MEKEWKKREGIFIIYVLVINSLAIKNRQKSRKTNIQIICTPPGLQYFIPPYRSRCVTRFFSLQLATGKYPTYKYKKRHLVRCFGKVFF